MTILYYYLAESLCELQQLIALTEKLESASDAFIDFEFEAFLESEMRRVKLRVAGDVSLFGRHSAIFLRRYMTETNRMILRLLDLLNNLPEVFRWTDRERFQYTYATKLKKELMELSDYFSELRALHKDL